jgi:hypothetical protein
VAWFAAHGMPGARAIDRLTAATAPPSPGAAKVVMLAPTAPDYGPLEHWINDHGEATFALWILTHPTYLITEPFARPERAYNYADGNLTFYAAPGRVDSPVTPVFWPAWWWLPLLALLGLGTAVGSGAWRDRSGQALVVLGALGVLAMLIAWQGDGQEVPRHTVEGFAEVRVCVLVMAVVGVLRAVPVGQRGRPAERSRPARPIVGRRNRT